MYSSSKHKDVVSSIHAVQRAVEHSTLKEGLQGAQLEKKLSDIDDHLVTLIGLFREDKNSNRSTASCTTGTIEGKPLQGVSVQSQEEEEEEDQQEDYKSPEEPVYKHLYYYDVENINDGSHSKYSRLSDIAADVGASDSAPHYAMVNGSLFLGKYLIHKVDTKVKVSVNPHQDSEKTPIEIV